MTNLLLCSDLHTNCHRDGGKSIINSLYTKDVDIAVVAGDLSIVTNNLLQDNIRMLCDIFPEVVFVTGNHSYYHSTFERVDEIITDLDTELSNFHFLNNDRIEVAGKHFIGGTLWFSRSANADLYQHMLNDFQCIKDCDPVAYERHEKTVDFLENNIKEGDIVVTHHMPTQKSVDVKYKNSPLNCYFVSDLDDIIKRKKPSHWLHGHTHSNCDYLYHSTRICCNPFGYPGENQRYSDSFVIRI